MKTFFGIIILLGLASCSIHPDGYDEHGYFIYQDSCINSHSENRTVLIPAGKSLIPVRRAIYICDSSVVIKSYISESSINR